MKAILFAVVLALLCASALAHSQEVEEVAASKMQCVMCMNVVAYLEAVIVKDETEESIMKAIDQVCARFHMQNWCDTNVKPHIAAILPLIIEKMSPAKVCQAIKVCSADSANEIEMNVDILEVAEREVEETQVVEKRAVEDVKCEICTVVVTYAKIMAGSNLSKATIQKALDQACEKIPFAKNVCVTFLQPYIMQIIDGLIAKQDPAKICANIKLCGPVAVEEEMKRELVEVDSVKCDICVAVLTSAKNFIGSDKSQAAIKKALDKACSKIPFAQPICLSLEPYIIQIVNGIVQKQDPAKICAKVKLCASSGDEDMFDEVEIAESEKRSVEDAESVKCDVCVRVVGYAKKKIGSDKSQAAVKKLLDKACGKIPVAGSVCKSLLAPYIAQIVAGLIEKQDPAKICAKAKLCHSAAQAEMLEEVIEELADESEKRSVEEEESVKCNVCVAVISYAKEKAGSDKSQAAIQKALDKACGKIPFAGSVCKSVLAPYIIQIVNGLIEKQSPAKICAKLKLCSSSSEEFEAIEIVDDEVEKRSIEAEESVKCDVCIGVINYAKSKVGEDKSQAAIQKALDKACGKIPFAKSICKSVLAPYIVQIVNGIVEKQNPAKICAKIKLCKSSNEEEAQAIEIVDDETEKRSVEEEESVKCDVCVAVINYAKSKVGEDKSQAAIQKALDKACGKIPFAKSICKSVLAPYIIQIVNGIVEKQSPAKICAKIKLCSSSSEEEFFAAEAVVESEDFEAEKRSVEESESAKCGICTAVISYAKSKIGSDKSQAAVKKALDKACGKIPFAGSICKSVLAPYIAEIVNGIVEKQSPAKICAKLKLCSSSNEEEEFFFDMEAETETESEKRDLEGGMKCEICTAVITYVKNYIGSDQSQAAVEKALEKACGKIPFAKNICTSVLAPYITQIVNGLIEKQDPAKICAKLKLCAPTVNEEIAEEMTEEMVEEMIEEVEVEKRSAEGVKCDICVKVLTHAKKFAGSEKSQAAIKKALDKACAKVPFAQPVCVSLQPFIIQIVNSFIEKQNPAKICAKVKLCPASVNVMVEDFEEIAMEEIAVEEVETEKRATEEVEGIQCELCTAVLSYVKNTVNGDHSQEAIQRALDKACAKIPFAKSVCSSILKPYISVIINGMINKQDPATICGKMKLCN